MKKEPLVTKEQLDAIVKEYPTPFHLYDEKGIRANAQAVKEAFSWNKGYKEYFAVKATPNPFLIKILHEYGCGCDCSSLAALVLSDACDVRGEDIMFYTYCIFGGDTRTYSRDHQPALQSGRRL